MMPPPGSQVARPRPPHPPPLRPSSGRRDAPPEGCLYTSHLTEQFSSVVSSPVITSRQHMTLVARNTRGGPTSHHALQSHGAPRGQHRGKHCQGGGAPLGGFRGRKSPHVVTYELENFLFPYFRRSPEAASVQITGQCEAGCCAAEVGARRGTVPPRPRVARPAFLPAPGWPPPCLASREPLPFSQCHGDSRSRKQPSGNIKHPVSSPRGRRPLLPEAVPLCCWTTSASSGTSFRESECAADGEVSLHVCCCRGSVITVIISSPSSSQLPADAEQHTWTPAREPSRLELLPCLVHTGRGQEPRPST